MLVKLQHIRIGARARSGATAKIRSLQETAMDWF
nr:hypothetical protein REQ54_04418 [Rhizobium sp. Q54]